MKNSTSTMLLAVLTIATSFGWRSQAAQAAHELRPASDNYIRAIQALERTVYRQHLDNSTKRFVQQLEDSAYRLRSSTYHPDQVVRLTQAWSEVQTYHTNLAQQLAGRLQPGCHAALLQNWQDVECAFRDLYDAMRCTCQDHGHILAPPVGLPGFHSQPNPQLGSQSAYRIDGYSGLATFPQAVPPTLPNVNHAPPVPSLPQSTQELLLQRERELQRRELELQRRELELRRQAEFPRRSSLSLPPMQLPANAFSVPVPPRDLRAVPTQPGRGVMLNALLNRILND